MLILSRDNCLNHLTTESIWWNTQSELPKYWKKKKKKKKKSLLFLLQCQITNMHTSSFVLGVLKHIFILHSWFMHWSVVYRSELYLTKRYGWLTVLMSMLCVLTTTFALCIRQLRRKQSCHAWLLPHFYTLSNVDMQVLCGSI